MKESDDESFDLKSSTCLLEIVTRKGDAHRRSEIEKRSEMERRNLNGERLNNNGKSKKGIGLPRGNSWKRHRTTKGKLGKERAKLSNFRRETPMKENRSEVCAWERLKLGRTLQSPFCYPKQFEYVSVLKLICLSLQRSLTKVYTVKQLWIVYDIFTTNFLHAASNHLY